ncbi:uncharacterized protein yc1106_07609 [Curvularia clavata]|uniref:Uncharacterized protein n=1 Tax=Curvularia clavata TaxID=95742 RepID=A0A9Q9DVV4_CURCL|nr:uncharacterized protein yc1106_07609 [Curvularia clavata]
MASQAPTTMPTYVTDDNGSPEAMPPTTGLARHDTNSSTGSARRPSHGNRIINISGACPSCHHQHRSLQVHVRIEDDSDQVGDVYCKKCGRLWLAFGNANATRLSLLSTLSIDTDPIENTFRSTLIHMIRSVTPIAVLSPTLTVIPEAASADLSRETSVRSTTGRDGRRATINPNDVVETSVANTIGGRKYSRRSLVNGRHMLSKFTHKARARFFKSGKIPFGLGRWFSKEETLKRGSLQRDLTSAPIDAPSSPVISTPPFQEHTEVREEISTNFDPAALDVSASSTNAEEALASLKALNLQVLQNLPEQERISWARRQLTDFRARHSRITAYLTKYDTGNGEGLHDRSGYPPRPNSILAYVGGVSDSYEEWNSLRERERIINGRPWSISETSTSDADTLVDRSLSSTPQHIFVETLHRDYPRSLSPRPLSMHSVQDWSQIHRNRAEARRSIDSTMTGGNVRSIATAKTHAPNRLSRNSIHRPSSSIFGTEPTNSRTQLRVDEETEEDGASQRPRSPSPSPPKPETDETNPPE